LTGFNYSTLKVLWVDECNNGSPSADFIGAVPAISAFVAGGGVFVYNSRNVAQGAVKDSAMLPGGGAISLTTSFSTNIDVGAVTPITSGPFGTITDTTLDGGNLSDHGFATTSSLPAGTTVHLIEGPHLTTDAVGFSYPFGSGTVYYATIPLDFYLAGAGNDPPATAIRTIYAPNMIAFACGGGLVHICPHHRVHGHIDTVPPGGHNGVVAGIHHGQHGHLVTPGAECPPHAPFHSPGLTAETAGEGLFSSSAALQEPTFVAGLNQDGTLNGSPAAGTKALPAHRGTVVQLFGSANGLFLDEQDLRAASGFTPSASGSPLFYTTSLPEVRIGGAAVQVLFSGLAPGLSGVWQINVLIPSDAPVGSMPVTINYEGDELTSVDLAIE
jgi:hypothetical protein